MSKAATKPDSKENLVRLWYFDVQFMAQERQKSNYHQRTILLRPPPRGSGYRQGPFIKAGGGAAAEAALKCVTAATKEPSLSLSLCYVAFFSCLSKRLRLYILRVYCALYVCAARCEEPGKKKKRKREAIKTQKNIVVICIHIYSVFCTY